MAAAKDGSRKNGGGERQRFSKELGYDEKRSDDKRDCGKGRVSK